MFRKTAVSVLIAGMFFSVVPVAHAAKKVSNHQLQASDVLIKGNISYLMTQGGDFSIDQGGTASTITMAGSAKPTLDIAGLFMATDDIGINLGLTIPANFSDTITKNVTAATAKKDGSMEYKPTPIYATVQYYFPEMADGLFRLYGGVGGHYTLFSGVKYKTDPAAKVAAEAELDNKFSWLVEAGALFAVDSTVFVDVAFRYMDLTTDGQVKNTTPEKITGYQAKSMAFNVGAGMVF